MNTTILDLAQNMKVRFHIGRGGHFHNAGYKTYVGTVNDLSDCFGDSTVISEDENGKPLPDSDWQLVDSGGNVILSGRDEIESETGFLDWDGEYNTDIVRYLEDCNDDEYQLILDTSERGGYVQKPVLAYVCSELGKLMVISICAYPSNMKVFTQEGCTTLQRDDFSVYTEAEEDEVRDLLADKGFISDAIEQIIGMMMEYEWFSEEEEDIITNHNI